MADPIVFDCGGSTRVKRILAGGGFGDMPKLLDVHNLFGPGDTAVQVPPGATGSQETINVPANDSFTKLTIMFQDAVGTPFTIPVAPFPASFVIASNLGQNVRADFRRDNQGRVITIIITIFSTRADPLVAAKQLRLDTSRKGRRRYVVENAGPIETITLNDAANPIFDATNPGAGRPVGPVGGPAQPDPGLPLYVSVVVS
jgi:hypothetical protein